MTWEVKAARPTSVQPNLICAQVKPVQLIHHLARTSYGLPGGGVALPCIHLTVSAVLPDWCDIECNLSFLSVTTQGCNRRPVPTPALLQASI